MSYTNRQWYYHYETAIWKYVLLLSITISEITATTFFFISDTIHSFHAYHKNVTNHTLEVPYTKCISYTGPNVTQFNTLHTYIPHVHGISGIARAAGVFTFAFCICLMNYLIIRIKEIEYHSSFKLLNPRVFYTITTLLCAIIILTGFVQYVALYSILLFIFMIFIYFCIFVRISRRFKCALLQRALERLIQHGSNKEEMKQYKYCKNTIDIITWGYLLIMVSEILINIPRISISILFFRKCFYPFNLFPSLDFVVKTEGAIEIFLEVAWYIELIAKTVTFFGLVLMLSPMFFVTPYIWIKYIYENIHGKKKTKYSFANSSLKELFVVVN